MDGTPGRRGAGGPRNEALERLLARAGWTPEDLGDRLNEVAAALYLGVRGHRRSPAGVCTPSPAGRHCGFRASRGPRWSVTSLHERLGEPVTLEALGWCNSGPLRYVPADRPPLGGIHVSRF